MVLAKGVTSVYVILPFVPADGQWNVNKNGQKTFRLSVLPGSINIKTAIGLMK